MRYRQLLAFEHGHGREGRMYPSIGHLTLLGIRSELFVRAVMFARNLDHNIIHRRRAAFRRVKSRDEMSRADKDSRKRRSAAASNGSQELADRTQVTRTFDPEPKL